MKRRDFAEWGPCFTAGFVAASFTAAGCSGNDVVTITGSGDGVMPAPEAPATPEADSPLYALHFTVTDTDDNYTSYIALTDSLDLSSVSLDRAREFPGFASIATVGGRLFVASATDPRVTSYTATPDLRWIDGQSVSFASYGAADSGFWNQFFLDEHTAYVTIDVTSRIVWDPTAMEIRGLMEDTHLPLERDGLRLEPTVSRQVRPPQVPVLRPFYYRDENYIEYGARTPIAVYDPVTNAESAVIDVPCPAVEVETRDEAGNAYFSAWTYGPELGLYGIGPACCIARITPEGTVDETWNTDLKGWTGGREVGVFRYMRDGKAIGTVLQQEEIQADFSAAYDQDVADALGGDVWRLWLFDLESQSATPIQGIGLMNRGFNWATFEGRTFVMVPYQDWSRTRVYEVDLQGNATEHYDTTGSFYDWIKVR